MGLPGQAAWGIEGAAGDASEEPARKLGDERCGTPSGVSSPDRPNVGASLRQRCIPSVTHRWFRLVLRALFGRGSSTPSRGRGRLGGGRVAARRRPSS